MKRPIKRIVTDLVGDIFEKFHVSQIAIDAPDKEGGSWFITISHEKPIVIEYRSRDFYLSNDRFSCGSGLIKKLSTILPERKSLETKKKVDME